MIHIVDLGVGNVASIRNMLARLGAESRITADAAELRSARKLILPGVGAFDAGMHSLRSSGLVDVLRRRVIEERVPLLGVCLGMQLLGKGSEEGKEAGLGWIPMRFRRFEAVEEGRRTRTLHMGWNVARPAKASKLFSGIDGEPRFYFVHRYYAVCESPGPVLATTHYGLEFASAVEQDNVMGVQFHPEKSHRFGMQLYRNFLERF